MCQPIVDVTKLIKTASSSVNVVEGVYPSKPSPRDSLRDSGPGSSSEPVFIGGNEGLAVITDVGEGVEGLQKDDWVIMTKQQSGTWVSRYVRYTKLLTESHDHEE